MKIYSRLELDDKDRIILLMLKENSRISYDKIGQKTDQSSSGVRKRVMRLIKEKYILGFTIGMSDKCKIELYRDDKIYKKEVLLKYNKEALIK